MKPKTDTKKQPAPKAGGLSRRRAKKLLDQLQERPELLAQFEAILGLATDESPDGPLQSADEVETRVVEATRRLGRQTMEHWAQEAQARAVAECRQEHPQATVKKKAR